MTKSSTPLHLLLIFVLIGLALLVTLTDTVVWDPMDFVQVPGSPADALSPNFWWTTHHEIRGAGLFRPMTTLSLLVSKAFSGEAPFGYHLMNLIIHLVVCFLLYWMILLMTRRPFAAFAGTLFYGLHPLRVESVALISGRTDMLCAMFLLGCICLFLWSHEEKTKAPGSIPVSIGIAFLFLLALFSKEVAAPFLLLLPVLGFFLSKTRENFRWNRTLWATAFAAGVLFLFLFLRSHALSAYAVSTPIADRLFFVIKTFPTTLWRYVYHEIFFTQLSRFYEISTLSPGFGFGDFLPIAAWALVGITAIYLGIKGRVLPFVCLAFFLLFTLPTSGIFPLKSPIFDRYQYIPDFGFALAVGFAFHWLIFESKKKVAQKAGMFLLGTFVTCLLVATFVEAKAWGSSYSLWKYDSEKNPSSAQALANFGAAAIEKGEREQAFTAFSRAADLTGWKDPRILVNLGAAAYSLNQLTTAESAFETVRNMGVFLKMVEFHLARVKVKQGQLENGLEILKISQANGRCGADCAKLAEGIEKALSMKGKQ